MSDVRRYDMSGFGGGLVESEEGAWYHMDDYAKLEAETQALREEVAALRARVVAPERMEYDPSLTGQERRDNRRYVNGWNDALSHLNGKAVSEGLLRRVVTPALTSSDAQDRIDALEELRDLLGEGKEVGHG